MAAHVERDVGDAHNLDSPQLPAHGSRYHHSVIDSHVIDQALPATARRKGTAGTDVQTGVGSHQRWLRISDNLDVIDIENPVGPIPDESDTVPCIVCDDAL